MRTLVALCVALFLVGGCGEPVGSMEPTAVQAEAEARQTPPDFTYTCAGLTCTFTSLNVPKQKQIEWWEWYVLSGLSLIDFAPSVNPVTFTFPAPGTYEVRLLETWRLSKGLLQSGGQYQLITAKTVVVE
jgi:hypothetical protein